MALIGWFFKDTIQSFDGHVIISYTDVFTELMYVLVGGTEALICFSFFSWKFIFYLAKMH